MVIDFNRRTVRVALAACVLWVFAARAVEVADMPDAVPGLEVSAEVAFDAVPKDGITFLGNEAWSLMYQPWHGQGSFAFQVGSQWYNTALAEQPIETGRVYRVTGSWDGAVIRVAVEGGKEGRQIRRDRMFDQCCLLVTNAAYLAVRDLVVCNAGKGLCIENQAGVGGHILVENCLAHHIEGSYRWNAHGIPEWRDLSAPKAGGVGAIALTGMRHLVFRDCETYQNSWGFQVKGDDLWIGRIYTHDNASPNTSPHPMITGTKRAWYVDSVLDASGWNASAGTMGIMLCVNRGFVIRGVHFLNMPDSASWDEGGVDFESGGEGILVDRCTFRRNAGAAIEVLGLYTPQARNLHFRECRFDRNNWANNLGPSEIYIHGAQEKSIDCSCGLVERCGYVLEPGIAFYTNKSCHSSKAWTLRDNREWPTSEELDRAMPWGDPPAVSAGSEIWTSARTVRLAGEVLSPRHLSTFPPRHLSSKVDVAWETREGPGAVRFVQPHEAVTTATFPCAGDWRVALKADDGRLWRSARTAVHVLPAGSVTMRAWSFAKNHDLEGWTHWNLGTTREVFKGKSAFWDTFANPVHDVVGDYYVVALKSAKGAHLLSPDDLYLSKNGIDRVRIRMQNRTNAAKMRLKYLTTEDMSWDDAKSVVFDVTPEDRDERVYEIPLALGGHLKRLRLDFAADETSVTGTVRIDYIWVGRVVADDDAKGIGALRDVSAFGLTSMTVI